MPKQHARVRSQGYYRLSPVSTPTSATYQQPLSARPSALQYYSPLATTMSHQQYSTQPTQAHYATGGPVQHPMASQQAYVMPQQHISHQAPPLSSIRPSSGAWNPQDDQTLMTARAQGMNWAPIQQAYFPSKTANACRKRHERLMERRNADDWDGLKLENLAKNYMGMRREIWSGLASLTGEKWNVVEQKVNTPSHIRNITTAKLTNEVYVSRSQEPPDISTCLYAPRTYARYVVARHQQFFRWYVCGP